MRTRRGKYSIAWHASVSLTTTKRRESSSKRSVTFRIIPTGTRKKKKAAVKRGRVQRADFRRFTRAGEIPRRKSDILYIHARRRKKRTLQRLI